MPEIGDQGIEPVGFAQYDSQQAAVVFSIVPCSARSWTDPLMAAQGVADLMGHAG